MSSVTAKVLANSQALGSSAGLLYQVPAATRTIIDKFTVTNTDSGAHTVTAYLIPSGVSLGASNELTAGTSISAGAAVELTEWKNHVMAAGDAIYALASSASVICARVSGRECQ